MYWELVTQNDGSVRIRLGTSSAGSAERMALAVIYDALRESGCQIKRVRPRKKGWHLELTG